MNKDNNYSSSYTLITLTSLNEPVTVRTTTAAADGIELLGENENDEPDEYIPLSIYQICSKLFWNLYFWSNITYIMYALFVIIIDYKLLISPSPNFDNLFIIINIIHIVNAIQYLGVWLIIGYSPWAWVTTPEWLNIISACLYLLSSLTYPWQRMDPESSSLGHDWIYFMYEIELLAAFIQLIAAVLWIYVWYKTYDRTTLSKRIIYLFIDVDIYANGFNFLGSLVYTGTILYAFLLYKYPFIRNELLNRTTDSIINSAGLQEKHRDNQDLVIIYTIADTLFLISSVGYLGGQLRDECK